MEIAQQLQESVRLLEAVEDACDVLTQHGGTLYRSFSLSLFLR